MAWGERSRRRAELPANWSTLRAYVLHRDHHTCQIRGDRCTVIATEVDHVGDRMDHRPQSLRAACKPCHGQRTAAQGNAAHPREKRAPEQHPGLT